MKIYTVIRDAWITAIIYSLLPQITHYDITWDGFLLALAFGIGYALGFALNNYYDVNLDSIDQIKSRNNYFVNNSISKKTGFITLSLCLIYFIAVAIRFSYKGIFSLVLLVFILWSYSAEPIKFKRRIGFDIFIHSIFVQTTPYLFTLYLLEIKPNSFDYLMISLLFLISTSGQIAGQLRDFDIDIQSYETSVIKLGRKRANQLYYLTIILICFSLVLGIILRIIPIFLFPLFAIGAIFILTRSISENKELISQNLMGPSLGLIALIYTSIIVIFSISFPQVMEPLIKPI